MRCYTLASLLPPLFFSYSTSSLWRLFLRESPTDIANLVTSHQFCSYQPYQRRQCLFDNEEYFLSNLLDSTFSLTAHLKSIFHKATAIIFSTINQIIIFPKPSKYFISHQNKIQRPYCTS